MNCVNARDAAKQVLREAAETPRFVDFSEAERLIWMLDRAFGLGAKASAGQGQGTAASRTWRSPRD